MSTKPKFAKQLSSIGEFKLGTPFGDGNYGIIRFGKNKRDGSQVVVKELQKLHPKYYDEIKREGDIMKVLNHDNIVKLHALYETGDRIFLIMEYAECGDLLDAIVSQPFDEEEAKLIFAQVVLAVQYLHTKNFIHRDIKPDNIFLSENHKGVRLGDYGLSCTFDPSKPTITGRAGTLHYSAPEMFLGIPVVGPELDIWSMGILVYVMLRGRYPFWGDSNDQTIAAITQQKLELEQFSFSDECKDLLHKMLCKNPRRRITIPEIRRHPWVQDVVQKLLNEKRNKGLIKLHKFQGHANLLQAAKQQIEDVYGTSPNQADTNALAAFVKRRKHSVETV